ncbi:hypothetical protein EYF80_014403 [Liparis tanakae]|uniref:Uncharacterized protein n=1 Tax=Liparis tanakae TaxID=230148 RepID=A0A4Z2IBI5_9TELE|nr:hypothetical protein EYF80_014403 [Liparis tanakae]
MCASARKQLVGRSLAHREAFTATSPVPGPVGQTHKVTIRQRGPQWQNGPDARRMPSRSDGNQTAIGQLSGALQPREGQLKENFLPSGSINAPVTFGSLGGCNSGKNRLSLDALLVLKHIAVHEAIQHGGVGVDINVELQTNSLMEEGTDRAERTEGQKTRKHSMLVGNTGSLSDDSYSPHQCVHWD